MSRIDTSMSQHGQQRCSECLTTRFKRIHTNSIKKLNIIIDYRRTLYNIQFYSYSFF